MRAALMNPFDHEKFSEWANKNQDLYYTRVVMGLMPKDVTMRTIKDLDDLTEEEQIALAKALKERMCK
jgi:hypothetical protein